MKATLALTVLLVLQACSWQQQPAKSSAPSKSSTEAASVRLFVKRFYDWFIAEHSKGTAADIVALKAKAEAFTPELLRALHEDRAAQLKDDDFIVGLDFDPFAASQESPDGYSLRELKRKGQSWLVTVRFSYENTTASSKVIAKVDKRGDGWRFTNFAYDDGTNLVDILRRLKRERAP